MRDNIQRQDRATALGPLDIGNSHVFFAFD
jgi:hypothetical protein